MDSAIKYSVIVPVYNGERTLGRCLDSLLQTQRADIQIILVDDGSRDGSPHIAQAYARKFSAVQYLRQENAGVSQARNTGLRHARGAYVTFVDSDDFVAADYFSMLDQAQDCDLLVFAHTHVGGEPPAEEQLFDRLEKAETPQQKLELLLRSRKIMAPWNKRFRNDIIQSNSLAFIEGLSVGEDFCFCMAYAMQARSIQTVRRQLISIDISDGQSLSRKYRPGLDDTLVSVFANVCRGIRDSSMEQSRKDRLLEVTDLVYVRHVFSCISEEFKAKKLRYAKGRQRISDICEKFRQPLARGYCGMLHRLLRLALKWRLYCLFYLVCYWVKGRTDSK